MLEGIISDFKEKYDSSAYFFLQLFIQVKNELLYDLKHMQSV